MLANTKRGRSKPMNLIMYNHKLKEILVSFEWITALLLDSYRISKFVAETRQHFVVNTHLKLT
jgi:hypothetical protein